MSTDIVFNHTAHQALWDWLMKILLCGDGDTVVGLTLFDW